MSTSKKLRKTRKKLPSNIKLSTAFFRPIDKLVRDMFLDVFEDYCERFDAVVTEEQVKIVIAGNGWNGVTFEAEGMTTATVTGDRIFTEVQDPYQVTRDPTPLDKYIRMRFVEALAHEMVHVMQELTGRADKNTRGAIRTLGKGSHESVEEYYFSRVEEEARLMEDFYANVFGSKLIAEEI